ncbi:ATP-binding protein [Sphingomonas sp. MMS12-HWE2-04]|uniref:ATP-binding response regulator n=1 Tax=Sphingomonas sp. MMS12-HWE2-04 TaxID=3234199 RepID=UPI00384F8B01
MRARLLLAALLPLGAIAPARAADPALPPAIAPAIDNAKATMVADPAQALPAVQAAEVIAKRLPDARQRSFALATVRWLGAEAYLRTNQARKAEPLLADGLRLLGRMPEPLKLRGSLLMTQGVYFKELDRADEALARFQAAYRIFTEVDERRPAAVALQNIALLYYAANDDVRAVRYFRQAASSYSDDPNLTLSLRNNLGSVFLTTEHYAEAEAEFREALQIARSMNDSLLEARILGNLARAQVDQHKFAAADEALTRAFALVKTSDATMLRRQLLATAARMEADQGDYMRAARMIRASFEGVDLDTTTGDFRNAHLYAHEIFRATGQPGLALKHLEALKRLDAEAAKVATTTSAALMGARFDYANQEAHIQKLKADEASRTAAYQRTLFLGIGAFALVLLTLLSFGLVTIRRSRNQVRAANVVLGETNAALEKALRAKTEFLATTSHEIRTPLNGILGMTQVMLSDEGLAPEMRDRIGIVHGAGVTMRSLVDDILDVAKMETGNLTVDPQPMDLCATLHEVTRIWEEQARAKGLLFRLELSHAPQWIVSDSGRLRQIVFNLLSNAVKFTAKGSVTVRALAEGEGDARRLKLAISDTGIGIPADKFGEIFESFRQVDAGTTRQFGGTGLGLTICRNLAHALGGDIVVTSVAGEGASFVIDLPLTLAEAPEIAVPAGSAGGTMLVLERNPIARSMLRTLFEPRVPALRFASSVEEAQARLEEGGIDWLLVDEATLKIADDPISSLAGLVATAGTAKSAVLWAKPDMAISAEILRTGIGQIIEKPVGGAALVDAVITESKEKSAHGAADPLVSRAA